MNKREGVKQMFMPKGGHDHQKSHQKVVELNQNDQQVFKNWRKLPEDEPWTTISHIPAYVFLLSRRSDSNLSFLSPWLLLFRYGQCVTHFVSSSLFTLSPSLWCVRLAFWCRVRIIKFIVRTFEPLTVSKRFFLLSVSFSRKTQRWNKSKTYNVCMWCERQCLTGERESERHGDNRRCGND